MGEASEVRDSTSGGGEMDTWKVLTTLWLEVTALWSFISHLSRYFLLLPSHYYFNFQIIMNRIPSIVVHNYIIHTIYNSNKYSLCL